MHLEALPCLTRGRLAYSTSNTILEIFNKAEHKARNWRSAYLLSFRDHLRAILDDESEVRVT